jgi:hypothetical protein
MYGPIVAWVPTECVPEEDCPGAETTIKSDAVTNGKMEREEGRLLHTWPFRSNQADNVSQRVLI